jgi:hypothetical protein
MSANTNGDSPIDDEVNPDLCCQAEKSASGNSSNQQFDTFESDFFQQGDNIVSFPVGAEQFDDLDGSSKRILISRQTLMGVSIVSTCVAVLACIALWRSNASAGALAPHAKMPEATIPKVLTATIAPTATQAAVPTIPRAVEPVPVQDNMAAVGKAKAEAAPSKAQNPTNTEAPLPEKTPVVAAQQPSPDDPDKQVVAAVPAHAPVASADDTQARCKKAIREKRNKGILELCPDALVADPGAVEIAVALAKIEFDRGRSAQAYAWGKKAITINPDTADAYVFVGGAEQNAGHIKAAKEAYKNYLRLAPLGRYAADLRAIVNTL